MTEHTKAPRADADSDLPISMPVEVLNADLSLPAVCYVFDNAGNVMPALILDRRALVFAGYWGAIIGFDLIDAAMRDLIMVDASTYSAIRERAHRLVAFIDAMPEAGVVRDREGLQ